MQSVTTLCRFQCGVMAVGRMRSTECCCSSRLFAEIFDLKRSARPRVKAFYWRWAVCCNSSTRSLFLESIRSFTFLSSATTQHFSRAFSPWRSACLLPCYPARLSAPPCWKYFHWPLYLLICAFVVYLLTYHKNWSETPIVYTGNPVL